ncbi:MAG: guanylate kinase [Firmicutes bacterium]|nr:guanylate kinase [Bacillota bacterium]
MKRKKGILFVCSGPSGVGKSAIMEGILKSDGNLVFSVSATTRKPREVEMDGVHYTFVSDEQFEKMIEEEKFLEWVRVHDNYYGTPRDLVEQTLEEGRDMILDIDVQGGIKVMDSRPESTFVFIAPPDMDVNVLRQRLNGRNTEAQEQIENRLKVAEEELKNAFQYDYIVFNDSLSEAADHLKAVITAERCRAIRYFAAQEDNQEA